MTSILNTLPFEAAMNIFYLAGLLHIDLNSLSHITDPREYWQTFMQIVEQKISELAEEDTDDYSTSEPDVDA